MRFLFRSTLAIASLAAAELDPPKRYSVLPIVHSQMILAVIATISVMIHPFL